MTVGLCWRADLPRCRGDRRHAGKMAAPTDAKVVLRAEWKHFDGRCPPFVLGFLRFFRTKREILARMCTQPDRRPLVEAEDA
jgi:hypothetical protein